MQNIFPLLSKAMWSRINSCYRILFSNLKQKHESHVYLDTLYLYLTCVRVEYTLLTFGYKILQKYVVYNMYWIFEICSCQIHAKSNIC